ALLEHRQPPDLVPCHQRQRLVQVLLRLDGDQIVRGDLLDTDGLRIPLLGDCAGHDVAIGNDPSETALLDNWYRADVLALHHLRRVRKRLRRAHAAHARRHCLSYALRHLSSLGSKAIRLYPLSEIRSSQTTSNPRDAAR